MKKLPYSEGTWFAIPLKKGGYAVGLVARMMPRGGIILSYFFGPKCDKIPSLTDVSRLELRDSIKHLQVSDLGLKNGQWTIIGESVPWDRTLWPMPEFIRREFSPTAWRVTYSDTNPNKVIKEERIPYDTLSLEEDGVAGCGYAASVLTNLLEAQNSL